MNDISGQEIGSTSSKAVEGNSNLKRACEYVGTTWFPIQPKTLDTIRQKLHRGDYCENRDRLFKDLSADCGLYLLCVKQLTQLVDSASKTLEKPINPTTLFRDCTIEEFRAALEAKSDFVSQHRLEESSEVQSERCIELAVSAQASLALAKPLGLSPELSYTTALFRQLGLTLIAWNYPHVYSRAVASLLPEKSPYQELDRILSTKLGFSPTLLGITLARSWSISPQILLAMGDSSAAENCSEKEKANAETLVKVCEIGEALARASHPERYPKATADWEKAAQELTNALGKDGTQRLLQSIRAGLEPYMQAAPQTFHLPAWSTSEIPNSVREIVVRPSGPGNKYARHCPLEIQSRLADIAARASGPTISKDLIETLIKDVIISLGFVRGCIYLIEPDQLVLIPRLAIGSSSIKDYEPLSYTSFKERSNPVVAAFRSNVPLLQEGTDQLDPSISAALGSTQRAGVLFLELSPQLSEDPLANPMVYFKAVREALNQCLHLQ